MKKRSLLWACVLMASGAWAQNAKPVRIIAPFAAGRTAATALPAKPPIATAADTGIVFVKGGFVRVDENGAPRAVPGGRVT